MALPVAARCACDQTATIIGDAMLDRYVYGDVCRISPEAPVMILNANSTEDRLGGAAAAASFLRHLGVHVSLQTAVGDDQNGSVLTQLLTEQGIATSSVLRDADRVTTVKERILGGRPQREPRQILRVDHETRRPLSGELTSRLLGAIPHYAPNSHILVLSDYGKGICTERLVRELVQICRIRNIPLLVDPARGAVLNKYYGVSLLKPNRDEAGELTGRNISSIEMAMEAAVEIQHRGDIETVVITLDQIGCVFVTHGQPPVHLPTEASQITDITGAGDMFLAALAYAVGNGQDLPEAVRLANRAAGLEVRRLGATPVSLPELELASVSRAMGTEKKVVSFAELSAIRNQHRSLGHKLVFTNGCFDLFHAGHLHSLEQARQLGDVLIVGLNSDDSVRRLKGPSRPLITAEQRARILAALACVAYVVIYEDDTPCRILAELQPDVLVKGGTYTAGQVVGREIVEVYGGRIVLISPQPNVSTTSLVSRIQESAHVATDDHGM
ncbi:MAG: D-glycero-beta-D-manno-heptose 1-phosphate adenylyltransferase [Planctomyces sp.]